MSLGIAMSKARNVPGEGTAQRLFARLAVRSPVGPKAAFYHRFGLSDPFTEGRAGGA